MSDSYNRIFNNTLEYENITLSVTTLSFVVVLTIICFIALRNKKRELKLHKPAILFIIAFITVGYFGYIGYNIKYRLDIESDINGSSYVTYIGEFVYDGYQKDSFYHHVYINDGTRKIRLKLPDYGNVYNTYSEVKEISFGSFSGKIVYGEKSKIIVDWELNG